MLVFIMNLHSVVIWKKELKHLKAEKKPKTAISEPPSRAQEDETKPLCQSNFTNSSGHNASITKRCDSEEAQVSCSSKQV